MPKKVNVFISSSAGADTKILRSLLSQLKVTLTDAFDFAIGNPITETIISKIEKCQAVIVVYPNSSLNVAYEFGVAAALKKPILVLTDPASSLLPFVHTHTYQRTNLQDTTALRVALDQFIKEVKPEHRNSHSPSSNKQQQTHQEFDLGPLLNEVRQQREKNSPHELEGLVSRMLLEIGLEVEVNHQRDSGVDCIVWNDKLASTIGNPILIEVKSGNITTDRLGGAEQQLAKYMQAADASFGLILYLDSKGRRYPVNMASKIPIIRFDLEDFGVQLQRRTFEEVVLEKRNELAHGGAK